MAALASCLIAAVPLVVGYLYYRLRWCRFEQFAQFPQPPTSLIWGNMLSLHEQIQSGGAVGSPNRQIDMVLIELRKKMGNPPFLLLDIRPAGYPFLAIFDHAIAEQITSSSKALPNSVQKSATFKDFRDILGPSSIVGIDGEHWKSLRKRFNPCFAPHHLMTLLPLILDKTRIFINQMDKFAISGEQFELGDYCTRLTFDIIGAVVMDVDFKAQGEKKDQDETLTVFRELAQTFTTQINRFLVWFQPRLLYTRKTLSWRLHWKLRQLVERKFIEMKAETTSKTRSVLTRSLEGLEHLDSKMTDDICDQLKTFLFAGHDTTSILLQWAFYELSKTPRALKAIRAELDDIFGPCTSPEVILKLLNAHGNELLSRMSYTSAVIKEILRLYPPASTARTSPAGSGFNLKTQDGTQYCADELLLYLCNFEIHRDPNVYGETADLFMPERWLEESGPSGSASEKNDAAEKSGSGSQIPPSAWRGFERGPRSCIGQELANIEVKAILAATIRRYNFIKVGLGELALDEENRPVLDQKGSYKTNSTLFNTTRITNQPVDKCMVSIKLSQRATDESLA